MMSLTPDHFRKVGLGVMASPTPFLTPKPERRRMDPRAIEWNSNRQDRDREVNVQVVLRCRPLSDDEQKVNVSRAVSCNEHRREVNVLQNLANKQVDRVFTFDKVFGPKTQQRSIYDQAISPIVNEVLEGFNCTVFAYGQTGTGKTYTMEGGMRTKGGELPAEAGVIPRAVRQIFDTLGAQNADYSMKVTFLELYNEEITDLLAPEDNSRTLEDRQKKPISLMEDGKGCVMVRGLEEETVYSANDIYNLLERGAAKRRTADTLLNKRSSRSHSVFSVTVYIKEAAMGDEELIKCGKLNLVDLAGSENITRSGARESRAREAGEINKSLLTLGRVINALVEHSVHIPYRDSKLTRLLRDSLGGKTKTCIIATISPSAHSLEETLSTLDYAHRAKNIKNKPEANQKMSKAVLLKDLYAELERMKQDVRAAREKNGVYIPHERFALDEAEKKARNEKIEQLEIDLNLSEKVDNRDSSEPKLTPGQAVKLCDRNFGIGADGVIFVMPGINGTDYAMRIFNSDGSEPEMCGNGVRCFAKFIAELENLHGKQSFTVHTGAGLIVPEIQDDGKVKVDMGEPILKALDVPTKLPANKNQSVVKSELNVDGVSWNVTCVSMGNPHCVTFGTKGGQNLQVDELNLADIGPKFEHHAMFPARTNTEFVQVISHSHLKMRVWERGAGATLACGTGACAVVVAAVLEGHAGRSCTVDLPGGPLEIEWKEEDNHVYMTGPYIHAKLFTLGKRLIYLV